MLCPHGLDNVACPICRIGIKVMPPVRLEIEDSQSKILQQINPAIKEIIDRRSKTFNLLTDIKPNLSFNLNLFIPEPPSIGKISLMNPPIYKRLKELDAEIPKEFNTLQEISVKLPDGKIKKTKLTSIRL